MGSNLSLAEAVALLFYALTGVTAPTGGGSVSPPATEPKPANNTAPPPRTETAPPKANTTPPAATPPPRANTTPPRAATPPPRANTTPPPRANTTPPPAATPPPPANNAPTISGSPATSVVAGSTYTFTPRGRDADGDILTYRIQNMPGWATFNRSTGRLAGTPRDSDIGRYSNIVVSVTDGEATRRLAPFSIMVEAFGSGTATLSWTPPQQRTDGRALTDLSGYRVHWGPASGNYTQSVRINNPGVTTYVIDGLGRGTYHFAVTAVTSGGLESAYSNNASKTIR